MDRNEVKEVASELLGWEGNKVFRTVKYLTIKPGQIITEYCQGEKQKYLSPVVYFFGIAGFILYLQSLSGLDDFVRDPKYLKALKKMSELGWVLSDSQIIMFINIIENQTLMLILLLPVNLVATWFLFKKSNPSFKQSSWFVIYISAQSSFLFILPLLCFLFKFEGAFLFTYQLIAPTIIVYSIWAAMQFYKIELGRAILLIFLRLIILFPFLLLVYGTIFCIIYNYAQ